MSRPEAYSLILTDGVHVVAPADADAICRAIQNGEKIVEVDVCLFAGADSIRKTKIVTAHVIALSEMIAPQRVALAEAGGKVSALWDRR